MAYIHTSYCELKDMGYSCQCVDEGLVLVATLAVNVAQLSGWRGARLDGLGVKVAVMGGWGRHEGDPYECLRCICNCLTYIFAMI
jgi:hypothetical protein